MMPAEQASPYHKAQFCLVSLTPQKLPDARASTWWNRSKPLIECNKRVGDVMILSNHGCFQLAFHDREKWLLA